MKKEILQNILKGFIIHGNMFLQDQQTFEKTNGNMFLPVYIYYIYNVLQSKWKSYDDMTSLSIICFSRCKSYIIYFKLQIHNMYMYSLIGTPLIHKDLKLWTRPKYIM